METENRKPRSLELAPLARLAFHRTRDMVAAAVRERSGEQPTPEILAGVTAALLSVAEEQAARDALEHGADPEVLACVIRSARRSERARILREYERDADEHGEGPRIVAIGIIRTDGTVGQA